MDPSTFQAMFTYKSLKSKTLITIPTSTPLFLSSNPMASLQSSMSLSPSFKEDDWVNEVYQTLENEPEDYYGKPVSIFDVPKPLLAVKPEAYIPQVVGIGPYHHFQPELYAMERFKFSVAHRTQKNFGNNLKFYHLVDRLLEHEQKIRSYYHRHIELQGKTLAWMMAFDSVFLIEVLQICADRDGPFSSTRIKSSYSAILKDIMSLENQIPLFLLQELLNFQHCSPQTADEELSLMLKGLYKAIKPFKKEKDFVFPTKDISKRSHLLEFLYYLSVPETNHAIPENNEQNESLNQEKSSTVPSDNYIKPAVIWSFLTPLIKFKPLVFLNNLPWNSITSLPGFSFLKQKVEETVDEESQKQKTPPIEEISIPSVTELYRAGVKFQRKKGDLRTTICFDVKTLTLNLPTIILNVHTETIVRNLVAYEACACAAPGALVFTRYIELMSGIIDSEEDVKLLKKKRIIKSSLKNDEVVKMWNSMSKSVKLSNVEFLDKVIKDVNKYYSSRWKVKSGKFMKKYVFRSWQLLTFLAAILLLLLNGLQAFCSVYNCSHRVSFFAMS